MMHHLRKVGYTSAVQVAKILYEAVVRNLPTMPKTSRVLRIPEKTVYFV